MRRRTDRRRESGAATLEMAIVAPLIFILMTTAAAFAINELGDTVGTSAARDGARRAELVFANASDSSSGNFASIKSAVLSRLGGAVQGTPTVAVTCWHPDGTSVAGTGTCDPTQVHVGADLVQVAVTWTRRATSMFATGGTRTDTSRVVIAGTPPPAAGGGNPNLCILSAQLATPSALLVGAAQLNQDVDVRVTLSSTTNCGIPTATTLFADYGIQGVAQSMAVYSGTTYSLTYYHDLGTWTTGTKVVQINATGALPVTVAFVVTPVAPPCILLVSPLVGTMSIKGTTVKNNGDLLITATVTGLLCGTPTITALPVSTGGLEVPTPMIATGLNQYKFDVGVDGGTSNPWTTGLKTMTVTAGGASVTVRVTVG